MKEASKTAETPEFFTLFTLQIDFPNLLFFLMTFYKVVLILSTFRTRKIQGLPLSAVGLPLISLPLWAALDCYYAQETLKTCVRLNNSTCVTRHTPTDSVQVDIYLVRKYNDKRRVNRKFFGKEVTNLLAGSNMTVSFFVIFIHSLLQCIVKVYCSTGITNTHIMFLLC